MKYIKKMNEYWGYGKDDAGNLRNLSDQDPVNEGDTVIYNNVKSYTLKVRKIVDNWFTAEGCYGVFFEKAKIVKIDSHASVYDSNFIDQKWRKVSYRELSKIEHKINKKVQDLPYKEGDKFTYKGQEGEILNYRWGEDYYNVIINETIEIVRTEVLRDIKFGSYVKESIDTITEYELHVDRGYSKLKKGIGENLLDLGKITDVSKTDLYNIKVTYKDCNVITQDGHYWLQIKGDCKCKDKKKK
jgi:hypothetical protein